MTIAVSVVVHPSRWLSAAVTAMCMCTILIGGLIACSLVGELTAVERMIIAAICFLSAGYVFLRRMTAKKAMMIHVSGTGQIRLSVWRKDDLDDEHTKSVSSQKEQTDVVHLRPASTLWTWLLILHLQHENGRTSIITVLPDSVAENSFRALLVACRWITMRHAEEIH
jgi:hypothetical protein